MRAWGDMDMDAVGDSFRWEIHCQEEYNNKGTMALWTCGDKGLGCWQKMFQVDNKDRLASSP